VTLADATPAVIRRLKLGPSRNIPVIAKVEPRSAAEQERLKSGDVVMDVDGRPVRNAAYVRNWIRLLYSGESVELSILRFGKAVMISGHHTG
jgi:S1-C subfamily serine protease